MSRVADFLASTAASAADCSARVGGVGASRLTTNLLYPSTLMYLITSVCTSSPPNVLSEKAWMVHAGVIQRSYSLILGLTNATAPKAANAILL